MFYIGFSANISKNTDVAITAPEMAMLASTTNPGDDCRQPSPEMMLPAIATPEMAMVDD